MVLDRVAFNAFAEDSEWLTTHYDEIRDSGNKVIAIQDKAIVVEGETMEDVLRELEERGIDAAFMLIEVIPPEDAAFIL